MNNAGIITGEMIGEQLLNNPAYADEELLKPYRVGGERNDNPYVNFYWDFFAQGKPAYVDIAYPTMQDMVELIKDTGGIPIPVSYTHLDVYKRQVKDSGEIARFLLSLILWFY